MVVQKDILFADDNRTIRLIMEKHLSSMDYSFSILEDGLQVEELLKQGEIPPLIILDWEMPGKTGPELCRKIKEIQKATQRFYYVILCTTRDSKEDRILGFNEGADDYICKPFDLGELKARIKVGFRTLGYQEQLRDREFQIRLNCYSALTELAETHCMETRIHLERVGILASMLATWSNQPTEYVQMMGLFAPMHDIGKVSVPESLLYLPRNLTEEEFQLVKNHTLQGWKILKDKQTLELAAEIALSHHEKWDGSGYPQGLDGTTIPLSGRITSICDVYDTLRSKRSYKDIWNHKETMEFIIKEREKAFDPHLIDLLVKHQEEWEALYIEVKTSSKITVKDIT